MCQAQAPRVPVAALAQVLPAGGDLVQVGELVGRVHVAGVRLQGHGQGVVVGGDAAQVAADERHRRAAVALPVQVQEVGHDQPERVQVPVQRRAEPGGAQHHVAQPLDLGRPPGRPLGGVDPRRPGARSSAAAGRARAARAVPGRRAPRAPGYPLGSRSRTAWPPRCAVTVPPVPRASRSRSSRAAAWKAGPTKRACGPRRTTRHAAPACRPRSSSVSGVRSATVKPKSVPNRSARSRSGFSNSSHASPATLTSGFPDRPGCSPGRAPVSLCSERCGSWPGSLGPRPRAGFSASS